MKTMPRVDILKRFKMWEMTNRPYPLSMRFGQWFLNTYFSSVTDPVVFYETNSRKALNKILNDPNYCTDAEWYVNNDNFE